MDPLGCDVDGKLLLNLAIAIIYNLNSISPRTINKASIKKVEKGVL